MRKKFKETIDKHQMLKKGDNVLVAVSGGVDSMALLYLLLEVQAEYGINLYVAHVNHGVRGEEAKRDQEFVKNKTKELGLKFFTKNVDMDGYAKEHKITSEEAGRILRYDFFTEIIKSLGTGKIAVGHNLNDQAETLLMRFLRGTGIDGLRGIEFKNENIIRPILAISREELEDYIKEESIEITQDHTNFQPIYTRNKIRLELIPYIEKYFNPNLVATMERTAKLAEIDSNFLEKYSKNRYNEIVKLKTKNRVILNSDLFNKEDKSIKLRIIRLAIEDVNKSLQGISQAQVALIFDIFTSQDTGKKVNISNGIIAKVSYNDLSIEREVKEQKSPDFNYSLEDGLLLEEIDYSFSLKIYPVEKLDKKFKDKTRYFDYDKISGDLRVRNRRKGDRFIPFGMKGSKKLKDYFIDEKVPRNLRDNLPIITDDKNIIWVVGYRMSNIYRIDSDTKNVLEISYKNQEDKNGRICKRGSCK